jgi:hypothetical protein
VSYFNENKGVFLKSNVRIYRHVRAQLSLTSRGYNTVAADRRAIRTAFNLLFGTYTEKSMSFDCVVTIAAALWGERSEV